MKRTLKQIRTKIDKVADDKRTNAAYSGLMGDNGASKLEAELGMFVIGIKTAVDAYVDQTNKLLNFDDIEINVPPSWEGYFIAEDKEYQHYLELKKKYEKF